MRIKVVFIEPVLGTLAGNKEIAEDFIISKHPDGVQQDELDSLPEAIEKQSTYFARNKDGQPIMWDYQVRGYFKAACEAMLHTGEYTKEELKKYRLTEYLFKKTIDQLVFVYPRELVLQTDAKEQVFCERPLRKENFKGGKVCLARSEMLPAGTNFECEITWRNDNLKEFIIQWLDDASKYFGLGQWRGASFGRFKYQILEK